MHARSNIILPSPLKCSLQRMPGFALESAAAFARQRQSARICSVDRQQVECIGIGERIVSARVQPVEIGDAVLTPSSQ